MKANYFIIALFLFFNVSVFSQNFNLEFHAFKEGKTAVLPGVSVEILDKSDIVIAKVTTNEDGIAKANLATGKKYKIQASKSSYEVKEFEIDASEIQGGAHEIIQLVLKQLSGFDAEENLVHYSSAEEGKVDKMNEVLTQSKETSVTKAATEREDSTIKDLDTTIMDNQENDEGIESVGLSTTADLQKVKKERETLFIEPSTEINNYDLPVDFSGFSVVIKVSPFYLSKSHGIFVNNKDILVYKNEDRMIVYMSGNFKHFEEAQDYLNNKIRTKYPKAYVVEFENGIMKKK